MPGDLQPCQGGRFDRLHLLAQFRQRAALEPSQDLHVAQLPFATPRRIAGMDERGGQELPFDEPFLVDERVERGLDAREVHPQPPRHVLGAEGPVGAPVA